MNETDFTNSSDSDPPYSFLKKVLIFVLIALFTILFILFIGRAIHVLLLIFGGMLLGTLFRASRDFIHQKLKLPQGLSLALVVIIFLGFFVGSAYVLLPPIYNQGDQIYNQLPELWDMTKEEISRFGWGRELASENPSFHDFFEDETNGTGEDYDMTKSILGYLSSTAAVIAALILIIVIGVYVAAEPKLYSEGFVRLFPYNRRKRVVEIMDEISKSIQWWLVGQLCSMIILGTITTLGLWLLGVPYALLLGSFTALMTFIPNLGPIIAGIPTLIFALTVGLDTTIYTGIFFIILQCIEGYFITPMIHQRAIEVPAVLIITVQFLLYYLIGFLGVLFAMPLMACIMIIVKRLYLQDILGDSLEEATSYDLEGENIF